MKRLPCPVGLCVFIFALCGSALGQIYITVDPNGGPFSTVQAAVNSIPSNNTQRYVINIAPGTYTEQITVPSNKPYISFRGQDANTTILTYNLNANSIGPGGTAVGTTGSSSTFIKAHDFIAENITFANSTPNNVAQAVAIKTESDRLVFYQCRFLGWQDTLYANRGSTLGRQYYENCYIEGDVDFIFGNGRAYFENCQVKSKENSHVTAQSKDDPNLYSGYVFHNCQLTRDAGAGNNGSDLGRPWRAYATVIYDSCWMDAHIKPVGWTHWNDTYDANTSTAFYAEFNSTGPGGDPNGRAVWSHQLTPAEVEAFSRANWMAGTDGWYPVPEPATLTVLSLGAVTLLRRRSR